MMHNIMETGELLTRWTARFAMFLYALALALRLASHKRRGWMTLSRQAATMGFLVYLAHVACAFQFVHYWRHTAAYAATARQTYETVGLDWGGGLYFNYFFTLIWGADVCWWWLARDRYEARPRVIEWPVQGFLAFMAFNATVIFATGPTRWLGIAASVILAILAMKSMKPII
jgi:hypothetical protein